MRQRCKKYGFLLLLASVLSWASAQELQLGGRVGGSTQQESGQLDGEAGVFAAWQSEPLRLGMRLEVNYQDRRGQSGSDWQMPLLATLPLHRQRLVEVQAGPYLSVQNNPEPLPRPITWGFSTGLQVNLPLSHRWVLSSQARADHDLGGHPELTPARTLSFSLTFGLAYLLKR